jgi:hypothetical protein
MCYIFFSHSPVGRHLGFFFSFWAVMNHAAINVDIQMFLQHNDLISFEHIISGRVTKLHDSPIFSFFQEVPYSCS